MKEYIVFREDLRNIIKRRPEDAKDQIISTLNKTNLTKVQASHAISEISLDTITRPEILELIDFAISRNLTRHRETAR